MMQLPTTYLFVPGDRPDRFEKALASGADAVILDLEDAIPPHGKAAARTAIAAWWSSQAPATTARMLVRINDDSTAWFDDDIAFVQQLRIGSVMLPKTERAAQVEAVKAALPAEGIVIPLVETARGILSLEEIAAGRGVQRIAFGTIDFAVDMDLSGDERGLAYPSARMALASRAAGIGAPIAGVTVQIGDEAQLGVDLAFARAFGFGAKLCIHPSQVALVHRLLAPTAAEIEWARRVVAAAEQSDAGAIQVDGKMVDRPVILKARAILDRAAR